MRLRKLSERNDVRAASLLNMLNVPLEMDPFFGLGTLSFLKGLFLKCFHPFHVQGEKMEKRFPCIGLREFRQEKGP